MSEKTSPPASLRLPEYSTQKRSSPPAKERSPEVPYLTDLRYRPNKKTQALGLSRIYFFGYFTEKSFGFARVIPES